MVKQVVVYDTETGEISQAVVDAFKAANPTAVSTDVGNTATLGSDNLIFVPEGGTAPEGTMVWRGAWDAATAYAADDVVKSGDVAWVAREANTGTVPVAVENPPMAGSDAREDAPDIHIQTGDPLWSVTFDTTDYTADWAGYNGSAWWKIVPIESGTLTVTETGLLFQNVGIFAVVDGTLTQLASAENSTSWSVVAGETYYIATGNSLTGTSGAVTVTVSGVSSYAPVWTPLSGDLAAYYTAAEADALLAEKAALASTLTTVDAGTDLSAARPVGAGVVYWLFDTGVDVGEYGVNVVNGLPGDFYFVAGV